MAERLNDLEKNTIPKEYHATLERCKQIENNSSLLGDATMTQGVRLSSKWRGFHWCSTVAKAVRMGRALLGLFPQIAIDDLMPIVVIMRGLVKVRVDV